MDVKSLMVKKDEMEKEMEDIAKKLMTSGAGISGKLTDAEGFPRGDIDIHQTLILRQKLNCLKNDYRNLMKDIDAKVSEAFSISKSDEDVENHQNIVETIKKNYEMRSLSSMKEDEVKASVLNDKEALSTQLHIKHQSIDQKDHIQVEEEVPILVVVSVVEGSPAETAGLKVMDEIFQFGEIKKKQLQSFGMKSLVDYVQKSVNSSISITVRREKRTFLNLQLIPRIWNGKGLLGCHLLEYK